MLEMHFTISFFSLQQSMRQIYSFRALCLLIWICLPCLRGSAIEPAKVNFTCNIHTINKVEGQTECEPLDDVFGGYCIIEKSKHKNEQVGHMGLVLLKDPHSGNIWTYDLLCPNCAAKGAKRSIYMQTKIVARCDSCNSEWQNVHIGSAGQTNQEGKFWLICYDTELKGDSLYVSNMFNKKR